MKYTTIIAITAAITQTVNRPTFVTGAHPFGLAVRGASGAWHRDGRGAAMARRDNREYRTYLRAEQRRQRGCIARRMQRHLHHGLLAHLEADDMHAGIDMGHRQR